MISASNLDLVEGHQTIEAFGEKRKSLCYEYTDTLIYVLFCATLQKLIIALHFHWSGMVFGDIDFCVASFILFNFFRMTDIKLLRTTHAKNIIVLFCCRLCLYHTHQNVYTLIFVWKIMVLWLLFRVTHFLCSSFYIFFLFLLCTLDLESMRLLMMLLYCYLLKFLSSLTIKMLCLSRGKGDEIFHFYEYKLLN